MKYSYLKIFFWIFLLAVEIIILSIGIVYSFVIGIEYSVIFITPITFLLSAFIFGYSINFVINKFNQL